MSPSVSTTLMHYTNHAHFLCLLKFITSLPFSLDRCGPCQLMAPQLVEAAAEFGDTVRVAKIDSDKFPDWSRKLNVGAFPTLLVFDGNGKEVQRVEGALMKNQILDLVKAHL